MKRYSIFGAREAQEKNEAPRPAAPASLEWTAMFKASEPADRSQPRGEADAKAPGSAS